MILNPDFSDLNNPETITNHLTALTKKDEPVCHQEILLKLLEQVEAIDFEVIAYPGWAGEEKPKIKREQYQVISIDTILDLAEKNRWGLCKRYDFVYVFNGNYWSEIDREQLESFLGSAAEKMGVPKFSAKSFQFRELLLKQFLGTAYLPKPNTSNNTILLNLTNGTFEVGPKTRKLRNYDRRDFITHLLPFEYNPEATAPVFQAYLDRVLPGEDGKACQVVLAEFLGYVFIPHGSKHLKEEKALILYGTGANGKSVFFEVVNALLGWENCSSYSLQSITNENGYFRAKLANKLVNYASEINGRLEATTFKQLVSGEPVEARLPYGQPFTLREYAKLIFNCNELPKDVEQTNAYFRRFLIIPFNVTIPETEQDKTLHTRIIENELSGIFNWVLAGLDRLLNQGGFSSCEAARKALDQYRLESDSVLMFLTENGFSPSSAKEYPLKDIYHQYRTYCFDEGLRPCSSKNFSSRLRNSGYQVAKKNTGRIVYAEKKVVF